jgi:hypothetical protein
MIKFVIIIFTLVSCFNCGAGVIKPIKKGEVSSINGFVIDHDQEMKFRKINEEKKLLETKTIALEELGKIKTAQVDYYKDVHSKTIEDMKRRESRIFWNRTVYFIGGIVLTGFMSYATVKYGRR